MNSEYGRASGVRKLKDLTGPGITDHLGIGGTDLGVCTIAPDGRLVAVFGDTFERAGVGGPGWRSPVVVFGDAATATQGIQWTGSLGPRSDYADQALSYEHHSIIAGRTISTILPTDIITIGKEMFLHVMACEGLGNVHWTEILRSRDNGETWERTGASWLGDVHGGLFQMLTWELGEDGYVYAFSTGFQRDKGLILHRVPAGRLTDPNAWEPWGFADEHWAWGHPPTIALTGAYGELCLRRVQGRWLLVLFNAGDYCIDVLDLDFPTANLYEAVRGTVLRGCAWGCEDHAMGHVAQLYGGYIVPGSTLDDLHLVVSQWNTEQDWPYRAMQFHGRVPNADDPPMPYPSESRGQSVLRKFARRLILPDRR